MTRRGKKKEKTTEKREEQAFIAGRAGTLHHSLQAGGGKGRQHSSQQAHLEGPQLGPQVILEGRSGKGSPRIKNGSHCLKLTDKMEAERRSDGATHHDSPWLRESSHFRMQAAPLNLNSLLYERRGVGLAPALHCHWLALDQNGR
jgi:hypothetical protein